MEIVSLKYLFYNKILIETLDEYICKHIISNLKTKIGFFRKNFTFRKKIA